MVESTNWEYRSLPREPTTINGNVIKCSLTRPEGVMERVRELRTVCVSARSRRESTSDGGRSFAPILKGTFRFIGRHASDHSAATHRVPAMA